MKEGAPDFKEVIKDLEERKTDLHLERLESECLNAEKYSVIYEQETMPLTVKCDEEDGFEFLEVAASNKLEENGLLDFLDEYMMPELLSYGSGKYRFGFRVS